MTLLHQIIFYFLNILHIFFCVILINIIDKFNRNQALITDMLDLEMKMKFTVIFGN